MVVKKKSEYEKSKLPFVVVSDRHVHKGQPVEAGDIITLSPAKGARQEEMGNVKSATPAEVKAFEEKKGKENKPESM